MNRLMIAAAAMAVLATGAANAAPKKHMKSQPTSAERAATRQLNEQQLAAATTGQPAMSMHSNASPPAQGAMPAPMPGDNMTPPAADNMTSTPLSPPPQG